jgi:hypothetical protein
MRPASLREGRPIDQSEVGTRLCVSGVFSCQSWAQSWARLTMQPVLPTPARFGICGGLFHAQFHAVLWCGRGWSPASRSMLYHFTAAGGDTWPRRCLKDVHDDA